MVRPGSKNVDVGIRTIVWTPPGVSQVDVQSEALVRGGAGPAYPGGSIPHHQDTSGSYEWDNGDTHCHAKPSTIQSVDPQNKRTSLVVTWGAAPDQKTAAFPVTLLPREVTDGADLDVEFVLPKAVPSKDGGHLPPPHSHKPSADAIKGTAVGTVYGCTNCLTCQMKFTKAGSTVYLNLVKDAGDPSWGYSKVLAAGTWSVTVTCGGKTLCVADLANPAPLGTIVVGGAGTVVTTDFWMECV